MPKTDKFVILVQYSKITKNQQIFVAFQDTQNQS